MTNYSIIPQEEKRKINRAVRYKRQKISAMLADKYTYHSVKTCMLKSPGNQIQVILSNSKGTAHFKGLMTCGSVWDCPICSAKISARRSDEIKQAVNTWQEKGYLVVMVTYTMRHNLGDSLKDVSRVITDAIRFVHSGAPYARTKEKYKIQGSISATEILFNPVSGWHYHKHQLMFIKSDEIDYLNLENWLFARYNKYLGLHGFDALPGIGVTVSPPQDNENLPDYISKWGVEDELTADSKESESYHPFELLDDEKHYSRFVEYSRVMYGKRRLTWSKGLRDMLGLGVELTDEELAEHIEIIQDDQIEIALIEDRYWRFIVKHDLRSKILDEAEKGKESFQDWFYHAVIKRFHLQL